jgi:pimeloyl-ACP methyl ester carboxylesterase
MNETTQIIETAPGVQLSVQVAGAGPLVILMHGWPELGLSWRHQLGPLAAAGYTVAVPDMRGYGGSSKPTDIAQYAPDTLADDMAAVAQALGARHWVAIGHDWGAPVAWRCALRFPDAVSGVFGLSVPHIPTPQPQADMPQVSAVTMLDLAFPDSFYYVSYFQKLGVAEAELESDVRANLKKIFFALSGDAPAGEWLAPRPKQGPMLPGLIDPPAGPLSFMTDAELDQYAAQFSKGGFFGPVSWYRNLDLTGRQGLAYGDQRIRQPAGFLCGSKEIFLMMMPGAAENLQEYCDDLRANVILPDAGHWIQQERPREVTQALLDFLAGLELPHD